MGKREQRAESREQVVFEPEFDVEQLDHFIKTAPNGELFLLFYQTEPYKTHASLVSFAYIEDDLANEYCKKVIARYKRLIAAAELAFILNDEKLDADFLNVIRGADDVRGEGVG